MDEIEVKILEVGHKDLEDLIYSFGGKKVFQGELYAIFYDNYNLKQNRDVFRLRREGDRSFLTYKVDKSCNLAKIKEETEIEVSDFEETRYLIKLLGFHEVDFKVKNRVSYKIDDIKLDFDKLLGNERFVPEFMEIEANSIDKIYYMAKRLGFKEEDCLNWGGGQLVRHYENKYKFL